MPRIPLVSADHLSDDQRIVYERIVTGPRRAMVGPLRAALHSPELAERWQQLGALLRYGTSLSADVKEIAILVTARRWNAALEWQIHEAAARAAGVADGVIAAIRSARTPAFDDQGGREATAYHFARELQETGRVSDGTYRRAHEQFATVGVVELTALLGYYTMVAMTLNAHEIAPPEGTAQSALPAFGSGLTSAAPPSRPA